MSRILIFLGLLFAIFQSQSVRAQQVDGGNWCADIRGASPENQCTFADYSSACEAQTSYFYSGREYLLVSARQTSQSSATCDIDVDRARATGLFVGTPTVRRSCPSGSLVYGGICTPIRKQLCETCESGGTRFEVGNPIDIMTGIKFQSVTDFQTADGLLSLTRHYSSTPYGRYPLLENTGNLGRGWSINEVPRMFSSKSSEALFMLPQNRSALIECTASTCSVDTYRNDSGGDGSGYIRLDINASDFDGDFSKAHDAIVLYDPKGIKFTFKTEIRGSRTEGQLIKTEYPGGYAITYENEYYEDIAAANGAELELSKPRYVVKSMTDTFGRTMSFSYGNQMWDGAEIYLAGSVIPRPSQIGNIERVDLPDGGWLVYEYGSATPNGLKYGLDERLEKVERFDALGVSIDTETYLYEDPAFPFGLTGIVDSAGINYASWSYSDKGLAVSSELADGLNKYELDYQILYNRGFSANRITVTNPLGRVSHYDTASFATYINSISGEASANVPADNMRSRAREIKDREGNTTKYTRNSKGWPTKIVKASGTSDSTTTDIIWHDEFRLPLQRIEAGLTTDYIYDDVGRLLSMTQTDTTSLASAPRSWAFTYVGPNVSSVDGPLPGQADTQYFSYGGEKLIGISNELGHQTTITAHNDIGAPRVITDPNGIVTRLVYDSKHRLTAIVEDDEGLKATTSLAYNANDLLTNVTQPNGSALSFIYDDARRLMAITNSVGERIDYTRNAMGGILSTRISGPEENATIQFEITQVTDEINRVIKTATVGGASGLPSETKLGYDRQSNLTSITDPRQNNWQQSYDGLNRLVKEIDPLGGQTDYGLARQTDARNPLSSVKDPRNVTTNYVRNGYGEVIREVSLENGITEYVRDTRGLVTQMTDARGVVKNYTYDIAGRLLSESYPSEPSSDITYTYDEGPNGIGELTTVTEGFGTTGYSYDSLGHMTGMTRTINGQSYTTSYTYDLAGEVMTETYPSGRIVRMIRDDAARITGIEAKGPGETDFAPLLSNITYAAFGPMTGAGFADGHSLDIAYDTAYRAKSLRRTTLDSSLMDINFEHDASGNILAMYDNVRPERSQSFAYDPLSRLTTAENMGAGGYGTIGYDYNPGGDRTARNYTPIDGTQETALYNYEAGTARLTDITQAGSTLRLFGYDDSGSVISDTRSDQTITEVFDYGMNARGRLTTVSRDGAELARYTYDMSEQRIVKAVAGEAAIHYHYDGAELGDLITDKQSRIDTNAARITELGTLIADKQSRIAANAARITELEALIVDKQSRIAALNPDTRAERIAELEARILAHQERIAFLTTRNAELAALITAHETRITELTTRNIELAALITTHQTRVTELTDRNAELASLITGHEERSVFLTERNEVLTTQRETLQAELDALLATGCNDPAAGSNVTFLHSDHLGRPKFATNADGDIVWDEGITTPFGIQITAMAAQTQALMFPGQYQDLETTGAGVTLSHNWHRTYDPTLGRYLQSDPIGLAGGLNRYAYVGGNPVGYVDPTGEIFFPPPIQGYGPTINSSLEQGYAAHISRNIYNTGLVCRESDVDPAIWKKLTLAQNLLHKFPTDLEWSDRGNVKYVERSGGRREMIFRSDGTLVTNRSNAGTYNYRGPDDALGHVLLDVIPYALWRNGFVLPPAECECQD